MADIRAKLKRLIQEKTRADGSPYSLDEIAAHTHLSSSTVRHLLTSQTSNPTMDTITVLANFFGVSPAYFFEEDTLMGAEATDKALSISLGRWHKLSPRDRLVNEFKTVLRIGYSRRCMNGEKK